jgi:hypothetical protein
MHVFSAPYHLWDDLYQTIGDNWRKRFFFEFFSVFNNILTNHYPYFHQYELHLLNLMETFDFDMLDIIDYAPFLHQLLGLVGLETVIFLDLLIWHPAARAFFQAIFQVMFENQGPLLLPCHSTHLSRYDLFLDTHDRAHSLFFNAKRPIVETLVYMYTLPSPFYDNMPADIQMDFESLQIFQENLDAEEEVEDDEDPSYPHPQFHIPPPVYAYHPDWDWDVDEDLDVHLLSCGIADMSSRFRGH